jgi:transposase-like protein
MDIRSPKMKKRVRRSDPQKQMYWEGVVRRWRESGQSVRDYCRSEGLRESAFYFWRRELQRRSPSSGAASHPRSRAARVPPAARSPQRLPAAHRGAASFLPVRVVDGKVAEATNGVEIVFKDGCLVRVRSGFDRQTLADVLAVLEVPPC